MVVLVLAHSPTGVSPVVLLVSLLRLLLLSEVFFGQRGHGPSGLLHHLCLGAAINIHTLHAAGEPRFVRA